MSNQSYSVLGAGSWGTALALHIARAGYAVRLWSHDRQHVEGMLRDGSNQRYLPGVPLAQAITPLSDLSQALADNSQILIVVPSHAFASVCEQIKPYLQDSNRGVSWATKGMDPASRRLLHEVAQDILGTQHPLAVLSGPTFASEVAKGLPTAISIASNNTEYARILAEQLHTPTFRAYTSDDMIGVQIGGAAKNVMAIAAGTADGLGFGANTRAALITRGLHEIMLLGTAMGGKAETFMGLAGLGDLALTCTDNQSRNRRMGLLLAEGKDQQAARAIIGQEVEGVSAAREVFLKAKKLGVEMPITEQTYLTLYEELDPREAVQSLFNRAIKAE
ncbi:MAG: NAD(P)-dependent glycerol-3-phosphate dehydrogenase [gamma proteobacterium symbiont of Bathyaustriella thionipta]|nr:NAD(P)-dependent glycerol-3-phosphate dehydrogenase [gamma proteobacterium symbiont of Bathyaustriella thionipta]